MQHRGTDFVALVPVWCLPRPGENRRFCGALSSGRIPDLDRERLPSGGWEAEPMTRRGDWRRVSKREPCPVCGRPDWCLLAGPEGNPTAALCPRVESSNRCGEAGWLHVLRDDGPVWAPWRRTIRKAVRMMREAEPPEIDFGKLASECQAALNPEALGRLACNLGLSLESLRRLGVGWSAAHRAFTFPMKDPGGRTLGIRLRLTSGRKLAIKGGHEGLFLPDGLDRGGRLLLAEGPTDTAAILDLGFRAVGRPSCSGGTRHVVGLVRRLQPAEVVLVGDRDTPGRVGAERLASTLAAYCPAVRVIAPPDGIKDARAWKRSGATAAEMQAAIDAVPVRRVTVRSKRARRRGGRR